MFSLVALIIIGAIFIAVIFIIGSVMRYVTGNGVPAESQETYYANVTASPVGGVTTSRSQFQSPQQMRPSEPSQTSHTSNDMRPDNQGLTSRPATPVNTHYRSKTPVLQIVTTPVNSVHNSVDETSRNATLNNSSEHERMFRKYNELSVTEKANIGDLGAYTITIYVNRNHIDPLRQLIAEKGGGGPVTSFIAYFSKKNDKDLSPSDKIIRRSLKIKNQRGNNTCRFARLIVNTEDANYYSLKLQDYTPYVEAHAPKFDTFKHIVTEERCRWEEVPASVSYNSQRININSLSVLVPN